MEETFKNIRLGLFVSLSLAFFIIAVYFIGSQKNLFTSTLRIHAVFSDVNGLQTGNNVRFLGIDIGTVKEITIRSESAIETILVIEKKYQKFIRRNAMAGITTDGLMGNKIIYLQNRNMEGETVEENDTLSSEQPVEAEEVLKTLRLSGINVKAITEDLKKITEKINESNSLWNLLSDSVSAENLREAMAGIRLTGNRAAVISGRLDEIVQDIKAGKGTAGVLLRDTLLSFRLEQSLQNIESLSDTMASAAGDLKSIAGNIRSGNGTVGMLLMDTAFSEEVSLMIENLRQGAQGFNENMEALKHNLFLRGYFKKKKK